MKKIFLNIISLFVFVTLFFLLLSCDNSSKFEINFIVDSQNYATINTSGNEKVQMPQDPTKDSYNFDGWYYDINVWQKPFTANSLLDAPISGNTNVYAKWTAIEYTATFKADGVTVGTAKFTIEDTTINGIPVVPNKDGYDGTWENYVIKAEDITVNAIYTPKRYTITYTNTKGVTNTNISEYTPDTNTFNLDSLSKEGYTFDGWYNGTTKVTKIEKGTYGNLTLEAKWTAIEYTATFKADGVTVGTAKFTIEDTTINGIPVVPNKDGYDGTWENYVVKAEDITVNAIYTPKRYTITYTNTKGVTNTNISEYTPDTNTFNLDSLSKEGYTFDGWYNGTTKVTKIEKGTYGNLTLEAKWTAIEYTATFKADGVTVGTAKFTIEDTTINGIPIVPNKDGYDGTWENYVVKAEDITVNAIYTPKRYTITWKNYDGKILETDLNVEYGTIPSYDGSTPIRPSTEQYTYTFSEWDKTISSVTSDTIYTALYSSTINCYTITWKNYDGKILETDLNVEYGTIPSYDGSTPIRPSTEQYNYTFEDWDPDITKVSGDIIYIAKYIENINQYTVTFKNYDGTILYKTTVDYGTSAFYESTLPQRADSNNKSYVFDKWDKQLNNIVNNIEVIAVFIVYDVYTFVYRDGSEKIIKVLEGESIDPNMPSNTESTISGNIETSYCWTLESVYKYQETKIMKGIYYISYELDGGTNSTKNPSTIYDDESIELFDATKTAYSFVNWYLISDTNTPINKLENISNNITLYAKYSPISYSIDYNLFNGTNSIKNPTTYTIEDEIILKDASKTGYTFNGWFINEEMTNSVLNISNRFGDIALYAKFTPLQYNVEFNFDECDYVSPLIITFDSNYENGNIEEISVYYNQSINIFDHKPTRSGYRFVGWYYDQECTQLVEGDFTIESNTVLYAGWSTYKSIIGTNFRVLYNNSVSSTGNIVGIVPADCIIKISFYAGAARSDTDSYSTRIAVQDYTTGMYFMKYDHYYSYEYSATGKKTLVHHNEPYINNEYLISTNIEDNAKWYYLKIPEGTLLWVGSTVGYQYKSGGYDGSITVKSASRNPKNVTISKSKQTHNIKYDDLTNCPIVEKNGYEFVGWYDENNLLISNTWNYTVNKVFNAVWEPIKYNINYILNGGENNASNPSGYTIESNIELLNPNKEGHTFAGWYLNENFINKVSSISNRTGNITLYAKFDINNYILSLNSSGGRFAPKVEFISDNVIIKTEYLHSNESIENYYPNDKEGYIFGGWYKDAEFKNIFYLGTTIYEDTKLYAKWIETSDNNINVETTEKIKVNINGKNELLYEFIPSCSATITIKSISSMDLVGTLYYFYNGNKSILVSSDDIDEENLNFSFTYNVIAGQAYYIGIKGNTVATVGSADITIEWVGDSKITGTTYTYKSISVTYGKEFTLPEYVEKDGYLFVGWYDDNNIKYESGIWNYTDKLSLHAVFEKIE